MALVKESVRVVPGWQRGLFYFKSEKTKRKKDSPRRTNQTMRIPARFRLANLQTIPKRANLIAASDDFKPLLKYPTMTLNALEEFNITKPTLIQCLALKRLGNFLHEKDRSRVRILSAETGSGKTLAYLIPIFEHLKRQELDTENRLFDYTRCAILQPTNELVDQTFQVAKKLSHSCKMRVEKTGKKMGDVYIGTPFKAGLIEGLREKVKIVVIDEADTLITDPLFYRELEWVFTQRAAADLKVILCSASISEAMLKRLPIDDSVKGPNRDKDNAIVVKLQPHQVIMSPNLHTPPPSVRHFVRVVKLAEAGRFDFICAKVIKSHEQTIVFCNSTAVAIRLYNHMLARHEHVPMLLHGGVPEQQRAAMLKQSPKLLITTDLMARGVHFQNLEHVILCGAPPSPTDYLHRVGRIGRSGQTTSKRTRVTTVVSGKEYRFFRGLEAVLKIKVQLVKDSHGPSAIPEQPLVQAVKTTSHKTNKNAMVRPRRPHPNNAGIRRRDKAARESSVPGVRAF